MFQYQVINIRMISEKLSNGYMILNILLVEVIGSILTPKIQIADIQKM
ncbi:hypothetical protein Riv7116_1113 [Rivularia sp. PCC 7116]|nr:hypothetical protein Riv7116_1113 [Rivularia sp. PCC 7116]